MRRGYSLLHSFRSRHWYSASLAEKRKITADVSPSLHIVEERRDSNPQEATLTMAVVVQQESGERRSCGGRSRMRDADEEGRDEVKRCGLWLPSKRRFCAGHARPESSYCGNHDPAAAEKRIPCPVDPSHTVLLEEVASHVKKCQATKHLKFSEEQPYYRKGVNFGSDGEEEEEIFRTGGVENDDRARRQSSSSIEGISVENSKAYEPISTENPSANNRYIVSPNFPQKENGVKFQSSGGKRAAITALSEAEYVDLVRRIESSHEACTRDEAVEESFLQPPQCSQWWSRNRDRRLPFQEKHVSQQASMLGNLEAFGLLEDKSDQVSKSVGDRETRAYVEFGAGRGYLSQMLCDSYGVSAVVLIERKAYKYKADRTLRQLAGVSVERLRTDIEDLNIKAVQSLQGRRYVAVSKHLCGPATDMTLRCCLNEVPGSVSKLSDQEGRSCCPILEGIGIATCCHHLCQWRSYVNKQFFRGLGFSEAEFHMITWLTSWAVNGNGEHAGAESLELEVEQSAASDGPSVSTDNARLRLSEAMDAMDAGSRAELGRKCKHLIDFGRLLFVRRHGLEGKIVKYISASVSPENKLLLAKEKSV